MLRVLLIWSICYFLEAEVFAQNERLCANPQAPTASFRGNAINEDKEQQIHIPVVVHVVHSNSTQNITDQQIYSQLKVLNEDYNRKNADTVNTVSAFQSVAANSNISFFIAEKDEFGNPIEGIRRVSTIHGPFANNDIHFTVYGGSDAWNTEKYLNIWVCDLADGIFGSASPPGTSSDIDGVVIDYRYFGTIGTVEAPYHKGRTTTHEIGHWLGLRHLWGDSGGCTDDDGIEDTPIQSGPSVGCDVAKISCGNLSMVQNYMDLSVDDCMNLFTKGQREKMRLNLFEHRPLVINDEPIITSIDQKIEVEIEMSFEDKGVLKLRGELSSPEFMMFDMLGRSIEFSTTKVNQTEYALQFPASVDFFALMIKTRSQRVVKKFHN